MDDQELKTGQELQQRIKGVKNQKEVWEKSSSIGSAKLKDNGCYSDIWVAHINTHFDVIKTLTLKTINDKLAELEKEYKEL